MRILLALLFSSFIAPTQAQFTYKQIIQGKAEILFSRKPAHQFVEKRHKYLHDTYKVTNGIVEYIVDSKTYSPEENLTIEGEELPRFYSKYVKKCISEVKGNLLNQKVLDMKGLKWVEFDFTYKVSDVPRHVYRRAIFFNRTFIAIDFVTLSSTSLQDADSRNTFFEGFEITDEIAAVVQSTK